jgi:hypothetical protein
LLFISWIFRRHIAECPDEVPAMKVEDTIENLAIVFGGADRGPVRKDAQDGCRRRSGQPCACRRRNGTVSDQCAADEHRYQPENHTHPAGDIKLRPRVTYVLGKGRGYVGIDPWQHVNWLGKAMALPRLPLGRPEHVSQPGGKQILGFRRIQTQAKLCISPEYVYFPAPAPVDFNPDVSQAPENWDVFPVPFE